MSANMFDLLAALAGVPALPGARCRGRSHLFDPQQDGEARETAAARHAQALGLCEGCPALQRCGDWAFGLPKAQWTRGVVAGRVVIGAAGMPAFSPTAETAQ